MERGTIDKQILTTLANNLREIQGTSEKLTPQELIDGYKVLKSEETLYTNLNEMTFGNTKFTITVKGVTGYYECSYMKYYLNGDSTTTYTVSTDTVTHNDVESITFYGTIGGNTWSSAFAAYITINGESVGTETDIMDSYSETFTITEDSDIIVTTSSLD